MIFNVDEPIAFDEGKCKLCGKEDENWFLMQLLADGEWRKIPQGESLRDHGLDEADASHHVYCVHACTEHIMRVFSTDREVNTFQMSLRERAERRM